ncbi:hypothetical protein AGMMS50239_06980 [Bacteroidia bacterium]|nr:hypothetical protein AGMMS50239_06980 [Bacteroidia bacterium]
MSKKWLYIIVVFIIFSCGKTKNDNIIEINQTNRLSLGDSIPNFSGYTENNAFFNIMSLNRNILFIFFSNDNGLCLLNEEILNNNIGKLAEKKNVDILFISEMKIANIYGIEYTDPPDRKMKYSVLFVVDSEKKIKKIFKNVSMKYLIDLLSEY